jgi:penicillin-binding protein 1A
MKSLLRLLAALLAAVTLLIVAATGLCIYIAPQIPPVEALKDAHFQVPLRIYSREGELLAEFGEKRRIPVPLAQVPDLVRKAVLAAEDDRFYQHPGVDYRAMLRAALHLLKTGEKSQGASTVTMQVARNFFLDHQKTYLRKLKEVLLALKIESELPKDDILELYLNKIYFGNRAYGIEAAAEVYYGRSLRELDLAQIAMIAGLPKAPSRYNPLADPARALARRDYVLRRMRELGYIYEDAYRTANSAPVTAELHSAPISLEAPYVAEMARAELVARFGERAYTEGFKVYTTLDARLQRAAQAALRTALSDYTERHGYRGPVRHVDPRRSGQELGRLVREVPAIAGLTPAAVVSLQSDGAELLTPDSGEIHLAWEGISWARRYITADRQGPKPKKAKDVLVNGDIVYIRRSEQGGWRLAQPPEAEAAIVALSPADGAVLAMVGGFDFHRSSFNRVAQAERQPGSSFKPFVYSAALTRGLTPATVINDAPVLVEGSGTSGPWRPENYTGKLYGPTRMREALVHSRNLVSIRVLRATGINYSMSYISRFGFPAERLPHGLSLALGSLVTTPWQLAGAYAVFANGGYRVSPYVVQRIIGADERPVWEARPAHACGECAAGEVPAERVISAQNAYVITSMMQDVVRRGTGRSAMVLGRDDLAGKTGTTNDHHDAWFCGFNADLVAVAWVGFDRPQSLGEGETGSRAALPLWIAFMKEALRGTPGHVLPQPTGLVTARIDPETGLLAGPRQRDALLELFPAGSVPAPMASAPGTGASQAVSDRTLSVPEQLF